MQIGIFGTGVVGRTLAAALAGKGHDVTIGTRDPRATLARDSASPPSKTTFKEWQRANLSNPLDFSKGFPPTLTVCNTDSLAERQQQAFPRLRLVKTLNTTTAALYGALGSPMFNFKIVR
jgi:predicted dinucleotide-binding enzyme